MTGSRAPLAAFCAGLTIAAASVVFTSAPAGAATLQPLRLSTSTQVSITTTPASTGFPAKVQDGTAVTLTVTATVSPVLLASTGSVTFKEYSPSTSYLAPPDYTVTVPLTHCLLLSCSATVTDSSTDLNLEPGIWTINAYYSGDSYTTPSSSGSEFEVVAAP